MKWIATMIISLMTGSVFADSGNATPKLTRADVFECRAEMNRDGSNPVIEKKIRFVTPRQPATIYGQPAEVVNANNIQFDLPNGLTLTLNLRVEMMMKQNPDKSKTGWEYSCLMIRSDQNGKSTGNFCIAPLFMTAPVLDDQVQINGLSTEKVYSPVTNQSVGSLSCVWIESLPLY